MAIITKPNSLTKGTPAALTLSKANLAALGDVSGDSFFSDTDNWAFVKLLYKSSVGNQRHSVKFDCAESSPASSFITSTKARDVFDIESISIVDFDGGYLSIPASSLNTAEFQLDYTPVVPSDYITWSNFFNAGGITVLDDGGLDPGPTADVWGTGAYYATYVNDNANFTLTYNITESADGECMWGFYRSAPVTNDLVSDGFYPRSATTTHIRVNGNTAVTSNASIPHNTPFIAVIQRTSGNSVAFKINGTTVHTITYSGKVYPHVLLGSNTAILNTAELTLD